MQRRPRPTAPARLKRKAFFVDDQRLRRARKVLGAATDAETVRASLDWVIEMDAFWRFMERSRRRLTPADFDRE
jgi:hypothetical protein